MLTKEMLQVMLDEIDNKYCFNNRSAIVVERSDSGMSDLLEERYHMNLIEGHEGCEWFFFDTPVKNSPEGISTLSDMFRLSDNVCACVELRMMGTRRFHTALARADTNLTFLGPYTERKSGDMLAIAVFAKIGSRKNYECTVFNMPYVRSVLLSDTS